MKNKIYFLFAYFILMFFLSCSKTGSYKETAELIKGQIVDIPYNQMDKILCSHFPFEEKKNECAKIVHVVNQYECTECVMSSLAGDEKIHNDMLENGIVKSVYIVSVLSENRESAITLMKRYRFRSDIYLDTCNVFQTANPQMPDNEMFHTFVINNEGKVLMVGNPFANEKMEALFKKVIANERKKQKAKKTA